ncbi:transketolase family protein, partial [Nitrospinae bacterium AH_259_B05_G02_I21]|nr:transketolase family protein [Nitrospinae bacterium AH_259_B05_G02_I21]
MSEQNGREPKATRLAFGEALLELGSRDPNVVVLDADLSVSTQSHFFAKAHPERFFQMGIAECNMIGTGAGMALAGKKTFICTFSCFLANRFEQVRMSIAFTGAPVTMVGTHAGVAIGEDGYSQMGQEDMAHLRSLPNVAIIQPVDDLETRGAVFFAADHDGPLYLRLTRQKVEPLNADDYTFTFGKGVVMREGGDVTLVASGGVVANTLRAAEQLSADGGVSARVVNIHTIKPIDTELLEACAAETGRIVTVEDHSATGGLGSAVC